MKGPVVIIGIGEMGGVFAHGFLRGGHPVYPITREMNLGREAGEIGQPDLVLVAVPEDELHGVLARIPDAWRDRLSFLQNELLPRDWREHRVVRPTVVVAWFEKKRGRPLSIILPSLVYGPRAAWIISALGALEIPALEVGEAGEMLYEMVRKNLYILTSNIAGLVVGGTVGDLWSRHRVLAREVASEVLDLQEWLARESLPRERLTAGMVEAFQADPDHECAGRSARARLDRALRNADEAGLAVPRLRSIRSGLAPL